MRDQIVSAAINIACGLFAAFIYDWIRGRPAAAPPSPSHEPEGRAHKPSASAPAPMARKAPAAPPAARAGGVFGALLMALLLVTAGVAAAFVLHRLGVGAVTPGLDTILKQGAIIGVSMLVFVWLLKKLRGA